jgi:hypothetical protein
MEAKLKMNSVPPEKYFTVFSWAWLPASSANIKMTDRKILFFITLYFVNSYLLSTPTHRLGHAQGKCMK